MSRFVCVVLVGLVATSCEIPGEVEGTVKFEDCRQRIDVSPDDLRIAARQFTCSTQRTKSGRNQFAPWLRRVDGLRRS